jgi:hypothetical protein
MNKELIYNFKFYRLKKLDIKQSGFYTCLQEVTTSELVFF